MKKKVICACMAGAMLVAVSPLSALAVSRHEVLMKGDESKWVTELQDALNKQGYMDHKPTGYFGSITQKAVLSFQKKKNLTQDGKAGPATRKALLGKAYQDISATEGSNTNQVDMGMLSPGSEGEEVKKLQTRLKELGYYTYSSITGYFGPITKTAVQKFQRENDLQVDGVAGSKTLGKLYEEKATSSVIRQGDEGDEVESIQSRLKKLKYFTGSVTGYFGTQTLAAVKLFQAEHKLTVDGKVGEKTSAVMFSDDAKTYTRGATETKPSESPSKNDKDNSAKEEPKDQTKMGKFLSIANDQLGKPYSWGQSGPSSYDCSGFVYYSLKNAGVNIGRMSSRSYSVYSGWEEVTSYSKLKEGDLVFFKSNTSSVVSHVGIVLSGNRMIHASSSSKKIVITPLAKGSYWDRNFVNGRRIF